MYPVRQKSYRMVCDAGSIDVAAAAGWSEKELGEASDRLDKLTDKDELLRELNMLKGAKVSVEALKSTKLGLRIAKHKKHEAPEVARLAREVVALWKDAVRPELQERTMRKRKAVDYAKEQVIDDEEPPAKRPASKQKVASGAEVYEERMGIPERNKHGEIVFEDWPEFRPNMTPEEVLRAGSFGGTYYRPIYSSVVKKSLKEEWKELPAEWIQGLSVKRKIACPIYDEAVNKYGVKCGGSLEMWESSGWINPVDPYGWFQWYTRFYQGRRTSDDERQIKRALQVMGPKGRFRSQLCGKIMNSRTTFDNYSISPVIRQTLQHWGFRLTKRDYDAYVKSKS